MTEQAIQEIGALYPGTNWGVYCKPSGCTGDEWEYYAVEELEGAGYEPCEMCYDNE